MPNLCYKGKRAREIRRQRSSDWAMAKHWMHSKMMKIQLECRLQLARTFQRRQQAGSLDGSAALSGCGLTLRVCWTLLQSVDQPWLFRSQPGLDPKSARWMESGIAIRSASESKGFPLSTVLARTQSCYEPESFTE